jgi:Nif-specific regulatory protein
LSATLWKTRGHALDSSEPPEELPSNEVSEIAPVESEKSHLREISVSEGLITRENLVEAMEKTGWVQAKAARLLGLTPRQIGYALRKHNINIKKL